MLRLSKVAIIRLCISVRFVCCKKSPGVALVYTLRNGEISTINFITIYIYFRNSVKDVQTLAGADIDSDHNLLVVKVHTRLKKIIRFRKSRPRWDLEKLYAERQRVQNTLEKKLGAIEGESGNVEEQWKNIKECVLDTISDRSGW